MKKPKNPGRKPTEKEYIFQDYKEIDTHFDLQELIQDGYSSVIVKGYDDYVEVHAYSEPYFHKEDYVAAVSSWELLSEKWNEWLSSEDGISFKNKQKRKEIELKEKSEKQKQKRIQALKKELERLEKLNGPK